MVLQCMEDAGCALPMLREMADSFSKLVPNEIDHHKDAENCGHDLIAHGDHFDCLVPLRDGSYLLSHAQKNEIGGSKFIDFDWATIKSPEFIKVNPMGKVR